MIFLLIKNSYKYRIYPNRTQKQFLEQINVIYNIEEQKTNDW